MEYYSAIKKNAFESVLMRWRKLEPIIQSGVSQKDKHQYRLVHWDNPEGWYGEAEGSGWGSPVYLWQIHFDIWQNRYNIVKFKIK